jgi:hypothetical protein
MSIVLTDAFGTLNMQQIDYLPRPLGESEIMIMNNRQMMAVNHPSEQLDCKINRLKGGTLQQIVGISRRDALILSNSLIKTRQSK